MSPGGFEIQGLVVPAYALFAFALGVLAGGALRRTLAAMSLTLVAFVAVRLAVGNVPPAALRVARARDDGGARSRRPRARLGAEQLARRCRRPPHLRGARGPRDPARPAGSDRPAGVPALAGLAPCALVPAGRSVLDVPGDRGGDLRRARGRDRSSRRCGSCNDRPRDGRRRPSSTLDRARLLRSLGVGAAATRAAGCRTRGGERRDSSSRIRAGASSSSTMRSTNPFFVPTRYGIQDACRHYGVDLRVDGLDGAATSARWSRRCGARSTAGHDGIAVSVIDRRAFNKPTAEALRRGIPVVSYNADGGVGNKRLAYVGQDLYQSGLKFGARIVELVQAGDVFLFIATPGQLNIQPRIDGALDAIKDSGKPIRATVVATGPGVVEERARIEATYAAHKKLRGMFAVDGGSTQGVGRRDAEARACAAAASAPAVTTCCRERCARSPTATSTSRSTSSRTCRASCRSSSSSWSGTAPGSSRRRTRTPACSS